MTGRQIHAVVTTIGTDRPGIVEAVAGWILRCGGNIEESRMAVLGGEFATIILVSGGEGLLTTLGRSQNELERTLGLHVNCREARPEIASKEPMLRYELRGTSFDQAGIIHVVAQELSKRHINIVSAETSTEPAPFSGAPVFHFHMEIDIPSSAGVGQVRAALADLGSRENLDLVLTAVSG